MAMLHSKLIPTQSLPRPNQYVQLLLNDYSRWAYDQEAARNLKGKWRKDAFNVLEDAPMDLEIGTGNGFFFAHRAEVAPERQLVGLEITYKTLIQTIRRTVAQGSTNARMIRFHASLIDELFGHGELNNVYIYFPDPWPKKKHAKNRLIQMNFLYSMFEVQRPGSFLEFKTDSLEYFEWALERFKKSPYKISRLTYDLHSSEWVNDNFMTHFEKLWTTKGLKTNLVRLEK